MVDYIGQTHVDAQRWADIGSELVTLVVSLNLYTISESCSINKRRSPLLPPRSSARVAAASNPAIREWNGVIFSNGTFLDESPG